MRGEILHFDETLGTGYITGDDGIRYSFAKTDLKRPFPIRRGARVDFEVDGRNAREMLAVRPAQPRRPAGPAWANRIRKPEPTAWQHFVRTLTVNYANFEGRARRKEFWGFHLYFLLLLLAVLAIVVGTTIQSFSSLDLFDARSYAMPMTSIMVLGLVLLVTFLPTAALNVRRFHDIGQSGWLVLGFYVASVVPVVNIVSTVAWLVMLGLDSVPGPNQYGPGPR